MKTKLSAMLAYILAFGLLLLIAPNFSFAKPVELIFAHPWAAVHPIHAGVLVPWAKKIEQDSNGEVKIKFIIAGAMAKAGQTYTMVEKGMADIGWDICEYTPGRFPLSTAITLPYMTDSAIQATNALWRTYEKIPAFQAEYADTKLLALATHDPGVIATTKKPINKMEDVANMKIKTANWITNDVLQIFKAVPVTITIDDTYMSLERGVIDGVTMNALALIVYKMDNLVKYMTQADFYRVVFLVTMNKDKYASLPEEARKVIDENSGLSLSLKFAEKLHQVEQKADETLLKQGVKRTIFSEAETNKIISLSAPVKEKWLEDMNSKGLPGQLVLDTINELKNK